MSKSDQRLARAKSVHRNAAQKSARRRARRTLGRSAAAAATAATLSLSGLATIEAASAADIAALVKDLRPGAWGSLPRDFTTIGSTTYFRAIDGSSASLWKTDGTGTGTSKVRDAISPNSLTSVGQTLYFTANDGFSRTELWKSDGTAAGTVLVKDINTAAAAGSYPQSLTAVGGTLFFTADDGTHGRELWKSDGTAAGTVLVKDVGPPPGSSPGSLTAVGSTLFFTADGGTHGRELWTSDGTAAGTVEVEDINPHGTSSPESLTAVGSTLFFSADDGVSGGELWKSDGTVAGTVMVADLDVEGEESGYSYGSTPDNLTAVGSTLFFVAEEGTDGRELWKSDGTKVGTVQVKDINTRSYGPGYGGGAYGSEARNLTAAGGVLYLTADDFTHGRELWKSDGTSAGTVLVKDLSPGSAGPPTIFDLTVVGESVFFGFGTSIDRDLWKTDGTSAGTVLVHEFVRSGYSSYGAQYLATAGNSLVFAGDDGTTGSELWKAFNDGVPPDTTPPDTTITGGPAAGATITTSAATFGFAGTAGDTAKLQCSLDGAAFTGCTSPKTFAGLKNGAHSVRFRAVDASGNADASPARRSFLVASSAFNLPVGGTANLRTGTLTLSIVLPGPGRLVLAPSGSSPVRRIVVTATAAGATKIKITPTRAGLAMLRKRLAEAKRAGRTLGRMKVTVNVTYTPTGGLSRTKKATYTLKLR